MSKNILDIYKQIEDKLDKIDWDSFIKKEKEERIQGQLRVANKNYCNWLVSFLDNLYEPFDSECWSYKTLKHKIDFSEIDERNVTDLEHFYLFLHVVADKQRVKEYYDDSMFEEYEYVFKYNNQYYKWNTLIGQGSVTTISKIIKPIFAFIDLDLYFDNIER